MGFRDLFRGVPQMPQVPPASPWATGSNLKQVTKKDLLGIGANVVDRQAAMTIPSIVKARALICGTLSRHPLALHREDERITAPRWFTESEYQTPTDRVLWTLDDLLFYGMSLWALERNRAGDITDAVRVPYGAWDVTNEGIIRINSTPMRPANVCLFEGPQEGLTEIAAGTIRGAQALERGWQERVDVPVPVVELSQTDANVALTDDEIDQLVENWEEARRESGTAYVPHGIAVKVHGDTKTELFVEGRNNVRLDIGNFTNLPGGILEGSTAHASLTYTTKENQRTELVDLSLSYWASPIEGRLSRDDITAPGTKVRFDLEWLATPIRDEENKTLGVPTA